MSRGRYRDSLVACSPVHENLKTGDSATHSQAGRQYRLVAPSFASQYPTHLTSRYFVALLHVSSLAKKAPASRILVSPIFSPLIAWIIRGGTEDASPPVPLELEVEVEEEAAAIVSAHWKS